MINKFHPILRCLLHRVLNSHSCGQDLLQHTRQKSGLIAARYENSSVGCDVGPGQTAIVDVRAIASIHHGSELGTLIITSSCDKKAITDQQNNNSHRTAVIHGIDVRPGHVRPPHVG